MTKTETLMLTRYASYITALRISAVTYTHTHAHTHIYVFYLPHLTFCYRLERIICAFPIFLFLPDQGTNIDIYMHLGQERCRLSLRYYIHVCHYFSSFFSPFSVFCFLCLLCYFFVRY